MYGSRRLRAGFAALVAVGSMAILAGLLPATSGAKMVAPRSKCEGQANIKAAEGRQEDALRCLINFARDHSGAGGVGENKDLEKAAGKKSGDVMSCGFSHTACGNAPDLYAIREGYASGAFQWGENLAWGSGKNGSARSTLKMWLNSPPHRETMLHGSFDDLGIGLKRGSFSGHHNAAVWVLQIGCKGC